MNTPSREDFRGIHRRDQSTKSANSSQHPKSIRLCSLPLRSWLSQLVFGIKPILFIQSIAASALFPKGVGYVGNAVMARHHVLHASLFNRRLAPSFYLVCRFSPYSL